MKWKFKRSLSRLKFDIQNLTYKKINVIVNFLVTIVFFVFCFNYPLIPEVRRKMKRKFKRSLRTWNELKFDIQNLTYKKINAIINFRVTTVFFVLFQLFIYSFSCYLTIFGDVSLVGKNKIFKRQ